MEGGAVMDWAWPAFWMFCTVYVLVRLLPDVIRAWTESSCTHEWDLVRRGDLVENMGQPTERKVGAYDLFRCKKCGASRDYR